MSRNCQPISVPQNCVARPVSPAGSSMCTTFPAISASSRSRTPRAYRGSFQAPTRRGPAVPALVGRSGGELLLVGGDERAVDRRLGREDLDLGGVHLAPADAGPALGVVRRIQ